ncbi:putative membrane protein [Tibeticola sediminis]|uniref:Putative membrane protein n=1 Tax=Tibeticola sediminis TaxID=1917811 RepID=A0A3N4U9W0_9BURK|nr:hypothetical protein [Tibeticola sediminis]RPE67516.1 putative membrane protein [Tibeticola sediminis]
MTDPRTDDLELDSLRTVSWISYILHLIVAVAAVLPGGHVGVGLLLIALILDLVKQSDAEGTWLASHFRWRIRTVFWVGALYVLTFPLFFLFVFPGMIAWGLISIWFLYRIVLGMVRMNKELPVE